MIDRNERSMFSYPLQLNPREEVDDDDADDDDDDDDDGDDGETIFDVFLL